MQTKPRYKDKSRQTVYETLLRLAPDKSSELYHKDGTQRGGANVRWAFWDGFNGAPMGHKIPKGTMLEAAFRAGQEFAKHDPQAAKPRPPRFGALAEKSGTVHE